MRSMQTSLGKVRGLGSARKGVAHWWLQRLTAIGLVPIIIYLLIGLLTSMSADYGTARAWLSTPINASAMLLLFGVGFYHAALGLQVVIEDYISGENRRLLALVAVKLVMTALAALSIFSTLSIAFS